MEQKQPVELTDSQKDAECQKEVVQLFAENEDLRSYMYFVRCRICDLLKIRGSLEFKYRNKKGAMEYHIKRLTHEIQKYRKLQELAEKYGKLSTFD